jgi:hypothetical protein
MVAPGKTAMLRDTNKRPLMRRIAPVVALLVGIIVPPTYARCGTPTSPPCVDPRTSARPGTDSGTGQSGNAGSLMPGDTQSAFAPDLPSSEINTHAIH